MLRIPFTKAHGAKNDFLIVDDRAGAYDENTRRRFSLQSAHRRTGVGSDGTIFIDASDVFDFTMAFYNPDGSVGSMCGNGGRCAALFAHARGIAPAEMRFDVLGRGYAARVSSSTDDGSDHALVRLDFPPPLKVETGIHLETAYGGLHADFVDNGAPHLLVFSRDLPAPLQAPFNALDMERIGPVLRHHENFAPRGCNVNVLEAEKDGTVRIRTFEKGVEAETWACGTGTLAAGMIAHHRLGLLSPIRLRTHGDDLLAVSFSPDPAFPPDTPEYFSRDLALEGPAVLVFEGEYPLTTP